jgi:single-strand DNA-binding protein
MNKVTLIGNLGKDPEVRHLDNGKVVANFSIATSESYKNKQGEKVTNTEWHNIVAWSPVAEIIERWVKKGSKIALVGKLTTRSWDKDGQTKYTTEVVLNELEMLSSNESSIKPHDITPESEAVVEEAGNPDDLPF